MRTGPTKALRILRDGATEADRSRITTQEAGNSPADYTVYAPMIGKFASSWAKTTEIEREEWMSQGALIYCEALQQWNPRRGAFSTLLWWCLGTGFADFLRQWRHHGSLLPIEADQPTGTSPNPVGLFIQLANLSPVGQVAVKTALNLTGKLTLKRVKEELHQQGWTITASQAAIREIKTALAR